MNFEEIEQKLKDKKRQSRQKNTKENLYNRIESIVKRHSNIKDAQELKNLTKAISDAVESIQTETLEAGYNAGVADALQEIKDAGITDLDLISRWELEHLDFSELEGWTDLSDLEFSEVDLEKFNQAFKDIEADPAFRNVFQD